MKIVKNRENRENREKKLCIMEDFTKEVITILQGGESMSQCNINASTIQNNVASARDIDYPPAAIEFLYKNILSEKIINTTINTIKERSRHNNFHPQDENEKLYPFYAACRAMRETVNQSLAQAEENIRYTIRLPAFNEGPSDNTPRASAYPSASADALMADANASTSLTDGATAPGFLSPPGPSFASESAFSSPFASALASAPASALASAPASAPAAAPAAAPALAPAAAPALAVAYDETHSSGTESADSLHIAEGEDALHIGKNGDGEDGEDGSEDGDLGSITSSFFIPPQSQPQPQQQPQQQPAFFDPSRGQHAPLVFYASQTTATASHNNDSVKPTTADAVIGAECHWRHPCYNHPLHQQNMLRDFGGREKLQPPSEQESNDWCSAIKADQRQQTACVGYVGDEDTSCVVANNGTFKRKNPENHQTSNKKIKINEYPNPSLNPFVRLERNEVGAEWAAVGATTARAAGANVAAAYWQNHDGNHDFITPALAPTSAPAPTSATAPRPVEPDQSIQAPRKPPQPKLKEILPAFDRKTHIGLRRQSANFDTMKPVARFIYEGHLKYTDPVQQVMCLNVVRRPTKKCTSSNGCWPIPGICGNYLRNESLENEATTRALDPNFNPISLCKDRIKGLCTVLEKSSSPANHLVRFTPFFRSCVERIHDSFKDMGVKKIGVKIDLDANEANSDAEDIRTNMRRLKVWVAEGEDLRWTKGPRVFIKNIEFEQRFRNTVEKELDRDYNYHHSLILACSGKPSISCIVCEKPIGDSQYNKKHLTYW